jgi:hypothetical protein
MNKDHTNFMVFLILNDDMIVVYENIRIFLGDMGK